MIREVIAENGVVTSAHPYASQAGVEVLKKGGNAVDAAVATALTIGVVVPAFSGVGGGGFMLIHLAKTDENIIVDYREVAARRATADMFNVGEDGEVLNNENAFGYKAVGVPGTFAGLFMALERYGTMSMKEVARRAVEYARKGFEVSNLVGSILLENRDSSLDKLKTFPATRRLMLKSDGSPYATGEKLVLNDLGESIEKVALNGVSEFYDGPLGRALAKDMDWNGGLIDVDDLHAYKPKIRKPLVGKFREYELVTMPPPSSGGIALIQLLKIFEDMNLNSKGFNTAETIDLMAKALGRAFETRKRIADPDFVDVPVKELISESFIVRMKDEAYYRNSVTRNRAESKDSSQTTHLSAMDRDRNAVSLTESLECYFGSGVVVPNTGIFLNDTMHDFDPSPGGPNSIQSGKRPMSSMTPTIFFRDGAPSLVLGSAAGPRIITAVLQVSLNVLEHGMNVQDAIAAARFHFQGDSSRVVRLERRISKKVLNELATRGYKLDIMRDYEYFFGGVHAIAIEGKRLHGGADPRRDGVAAGY